MYKHYNTKSTDNRCIKLKHTTGHFNCAVYLYSQTVQLSYKLCSMHTYTYRVSTGSNFLFLFVSGKFRAVQ